MDTSTRTPRRKRSPGIGVLLGAMLGLAGCAPEPAAQAEPVPPLPISINEVMVGAIDHASHAIWEVALEENTPVTDEDWREVEHHAIQVVAAGSAILLGGTGVGDPVWSRGEEWKAYSRAMADAGMDAMEAARARNLDAVIEAGDRLIVPCEGCHAVYKPNLPSEGIYHPH